MRVQSLHDPEMEWRLIDLQGLDLTAAPVKLLCILGPNGVGKTSLLKCIAGLLPLTTGNVFYKGRDMTKMDRMTVARSLAYVPQIHYPVFAYTVFETVLMGRTPYLGFFSFPDPEDERIAGDAIESMGIGCIQDVDELSKLCGSFDSCGVLQAAQFASSTIDAPHRLETET